jgi:hypothetical protein
MVIEVDDDHALAVGVKGSTQRVEDPAIADDIQADCCRATRSWR